jgi:transposase
MDAVWSARQTRSPVRDAVTCPLACHRPRIADRDCFCGIVVRRVTGPSWSTTARLCGVSATTLRGRRDEWVAAGVFEQLVGEAR